MSHSVSVSLQKASSLAVAQVKPWYRRKVLGTPQPWVGGLPLLGNPLFSAPENWATDTEVNRDVPGHLTGLSVLRC